MAYKILVFTTLISICCAGYETPTPGLSAYATHTIAKYAAVPGSNPSSYSTSSFPIPYQTEQHTNAYVSPSYPLHSGHVAYAPAAKTVYAEPEAPPYYQYGYAVNDPLTGDSKTQQESREGDVVHGSYSLIDADGSKRTVEYTADPHNGFNAVVHREPPKQHGYYPQPNYQQ